MSALAGVPDCRWGRIDEYFEGLDKVSERLPTFRGELYLEYHRGVLTSQHAMKAAYRKAERSLQVAEAAPLPSGNR